MPSRLLSDRETVLDQLRFSDYKEALVQAIRTAYTPITIAIYGTWGSGKTSLMRMVEKALSGEHCCVWFDAWKYDKEPLLWRAFLQHVISRFRLAVRSEEARKTLDDLEQSLYRDVARQELGRFTVDWARLTKGMLKLGKGALELALPVAPVRGIGETVERVAEKGADAVDDLVDAFHRRRAEIHIKRVEFLDEFLRKFGEVVRYVTNQNQLLVVFVDDLDRCLPEKSIQVLEAIKLFMGVEGTVFLVGIDPKVIERGIEVRYRGFRRAGAADDLPISGERYIEKIVQLPFTLPPIDREHQMREFIQALKAELPGRCPEVFAIGLEANPRRVKRTINIFTLLRLLVDRRAELKDAVDWELLAKIVIVQAAHRDLYEDLLTYPALLLDLGACRRISLRMSGQT